VVEKDPWPMLICATKMRSLARLKPRNGQIPSKQPVVSRIPSRRSQPTPVVGLPNPSSADGVVGFPLLLHPLPALRLALYLFAKLPEAVSPAHGICPSSRSSSRCSS
jgi:hypothetical protein